MGGEDQGGRVRSPHVTGSDLEDKFEVLVRYGTQLTQLCQDAARPASRTKLC